VDNQQLNEFKEFILYKVQEITTNLTDVSNNNKVLYKTMSKMADKMDIDLTPLLDESIQEIANDNAMLLEALKDEGFIQQVDTEREKESIINSFQIFKDSLDDPEKFKTEYLKEIKENIERNKQRAEQTKKQKPKIIKPNMQEHSKYSKKNK
jgi:hypothetical protein